MDDESKEPKSMLEAVEEGVEKADEEAGVAKKKKKSANSGIFQNMRDALAKKKQQIEDAEQ